MLTAIAGQGSTDGVAAAASHLPDCKTHRDTFPLPLCLSLCICNSAFLWAFIEHVTDATRLWIWHTANKSQICNVFLNGGNPRRASPKSIPWTCRYGFWFKAIQYAWLPKGSTPVGTKNTSMQLNSKPCWIKLQCRWAPHSISVCLCQGSERAQVAVREQPGFQGDRNNVRRAKHSKTSLVNLLVLGFTRNLAKFPSGPNFFKSLNLPSFV